MGHLNNGSTGRRKITPHLPSHYSLRGPMRAPWPQFAQLSALHAVSPVTVRISGTASLSHGYQPTRAPYCFSAQYFK